MKQKLQGGQTVRVEARGMNRAVGKVSKVGNRTVGVDLEGKTFWFVREALTLLEDSKPS